MENAENGVVVNTLVVKGCEAVPVTVRATVRPDGAPGVEIDGLSETARVEMRAAVRCALGAAGCWLPRRGVHIEIAPDVRGRAVSGLELPVAAAILAASGQIPKAGLDECRLVGNLSLEGKVLPSEGVRLFQTQLPEGAGLVASRGCDGDVLPAGRYASEVLGIGELGELRRGVSSLTRCAAGPSVDAVGEDVEAGFGEDAARAVEVACAGGHNLLLKGADEAALIAAAGSVAACMPAPSEAEAVRIAAMTSIGAGADHRGGIGERSTVFWDARTGTLPELIGGGRPVRPGAVSMAAGGALVIGHIDEMSEAASQMLGHAMFDREVRVVRADGSFLMPADTMVVGCMGPEGRLPEALRGFPFACAEVGDRPEPGYGAKVAEVRRTVEAARDFARKEDGRLEALGDDPEDIVARTIADLAAARDVDIDHQGEAHDMTRPATGRLFIYRVPARAPELSLDALASEKAMVAQALTGEGLAARTGDAR